MKYAIISDIHGNLAAFKWTLADARKRGCGKIICLGDLTGYGKRSVECVALAIKEVDICLMGNHDSACCGKEEPVELIFNRNYDVDVATRDSLERRQMEWLRERPYVMQGKGFACTHGEFTRPKEWGYIINPVDAWLSLRAMNEAVLFVGHSHVPGILKLSAADAKKAKSMDQKTAIEGLSGLSPVKAMSFVVERGARYVVNVGSVGLPRMGSKAAYAIYDDKARSVDLIEVNCGRRKMSLQSYLSGWA